jgi:hypothetical protein
MDEVDAQIVVHSFSAIYISLLANPIKHAALSERAPRSLSRNEGLRHHEHGVERVDTIRLACATSRITSNVMAANSSVVQ